MKQCCNEGYVDREELLGHVNDEEGCNEKDSDCGCAAHGR